MKCTLNVGDRVRARMDVDYWNSPGMQQEKHKIFTVRKIEKSTIFDYFFIYFHPLEDWNCYDKDLIKIDDQWD